MKAIYVFMRKSGPRDITIPEVGMYMEALLRVMPTEILFTRRKSELKTADFGFLQTTAGLGIPNWKEEVRRMYADMKEVCGEVFVYAGNLEAAMVPGCKSYGNSPTATIVATPRVKELLPYSPPTKQGSVYVGWRRQARAGMLRDMARAGMLTHIVGDGWWKDAGYFPCTVLPGVPCDDVVKTYREYEIGVHVTEKLYDANEIVCYRPWEICCACRPMILSPTNPVHARWIQAYLGWAELAKGLGTLTHEHASNTWRKVILESGVYMTLDEMEASFRRGLCGTY